MCWLLAECQLLQHLARPSLVAKDHVGVPLTGGDVQNPVGVLPAAADMDVSGGLGV